MFGYKIVTKEDHAFLEKWMEYKDRESPTGYRWWYGVYLPTPDTKNDWVPVGYLDEMLNRAQAEIDEVKKSRAKWREKAHQYRRQRQLLVEKLKLKETQNGQAQPDSSNREE